MNKQNTDEFNNYILQRLTPREQKAALNVLNKLKNLFKSAANSADNSDIYKKLFSIKSSSTCKDIFNVISSKSNDCSQNEIYNLPIFQLDSSLNEHSDSKVSLTITVKHIKIKLLMLYISKNKLLIIL